MHSKKLNSEQNVIINHVEGAILVLAPVGTGKTSVLVERVLNAIDTGISPKRILCLTFTNRAAKEMKERLTEDCPDRLRELTINTFHGLCAAILRIEARQFGLPTDFVIYDDADSTELIKEVFNLSDKKEIKEKKIKLLDCKVKAQESQLSLDNLAGNLYASLGIKDAKCAARYQTILKKRHALDFTDLIFYVRVMFKNEPEISQRWANKFDFIQVDEVQDTHLSEYGIIKHLAAKSKNLAMIGDLDQTIYEWRGSEPEEVIEQFKSDFNPTTHSLVLNYRSTITLLEAASEFANSFENRQTSITPAPGCKVGESIQIHSADDGQAEAEWIAIQIHQLASSKEDFDYSRVAVLARQHERTKVVSETLEIMGIPCVTVEKFKFFMRPEVKAAFAYLRLILNPFDIAAMRRILLLRSRAGGDEVINAVIEEGKSCGFSLTDMASRRTLTDRDPFSEILRAYSSGIITVFDVETTGLSASKDEVIEIAAIQLVNGKPQKEFHKYITNTVKVGNSERIHGHSDLFLLENGMPVKDVFNEFFEFAKNSVLVGHNVGFDIKMVTAQAQKAKITVPKLQWCDTLDLAHRFIPADRYSLDALAKQLKLANVPDHKAINDVKATIDLLANLVPLVKVKTEQRQALVDRYGSRFRVLAGQIDDWREASQTLRPADLLDKILTESGLSRYYQDKDQYKCFSNLKYLISIFQEQDDLTLHPDTALRDIIEFTTLARDLDQVSQYNNQVPIITVHQSKGLEFDSVFIAGSTEDEFPHFFSIRDNKLEEEKRLFYVAMTRAKQRLFVSNYSEDERGRPKTRSQFIDTIQGQTNLCMETYTESDRTIT